MSKSIKLLIEQCIDLMRELAYAESTIKEHCRRINQTVVSYMESHGLEAYNTDIGIKALQSMPHDDKWQRYYRSIALLNSVITEGKISKTQPKKSWDLPGEIGDIAKQLLSLKQSERVSPHTIEVYQRIISQFITALHIKGVKNVSEITESHIVDFVSTTTNGKGQRLYIMKMFCQYLLNEGHVKYSLGSLLDSAKSPQREKIPTVYNQDEIALIEASIDRCGFGGCRMYAIFLLASRLGLRVSDIIRLRFSNIDWDKCTISIVQYKTKHEVVLPLLTDIGNAIIDYLQRERPESDDDHVFISMRLPYGGITRDAVWCGLQKVIQKSGVNITRRRHGIHAFRHSLASQLLSKDTPLPIISSTLGHASVATTSNYLKVDMKKLRSILLAPTLVPESFYMQKGGIFYE